jgi:hypothetical protein
LGIPAINRLSEGSDLNISYLPSFERRTVRKNFRPAVMDTLKRGNPEWVFIGDSMLGSRLDAAVLDRLAHEGNRGSGYLVRAASGPAWWYLSFKNHLIASGIRPRVTFFFFRDTNMTDTLFRLQNSLGDALDEVARDTEPELDRVVAARQRGGWWRVDRVLNRLYEVDVASAWLHPAIRQWYVSRKYSDAEVRQRFEQRIEDSFNQHLRRDVTADLAGESAMQQNRADFHRDLPVSVLPLIAALARDHQLKICFVRVQRRPEGNAPPSQPPALQRYMSDFRAWAESRNACFYDETGDPELTLDLYADGDHVGDAARYTQVFHHRLAPLFR